MAKLFDLTKVMKELSKHVPRAKALRSAAVIPDEDICCEECGEYVGKLKLTKDGFFHCEPCDFMYVRRKAVQEFDDN
jgi:formamidopyrimidine-DNA glycosylase